MAEDGGAVWRKERERRERVRKKKEEEQNAGASADGEEWVGAKTLPRVADLIKWKREDRQKPRSAPPRPNSNLNQAMLGDYCCQLLPLTARRTNQ